MAEHSALPWTASHEGVFSEGSCIAVTDCDSDHISVERANAAFIAQACNAHDALVKALAEYLVLGKGKCVIGAATCEKALAALKLAGVAE